MISLHYYFTKKLTRYYPELQWIYISCDATHPLYDPFEPEYAYMFPYWNAEA